jgi:predicted esterase
MSLFYAGRLTEVLEVSRDLWRRYPSRGEIPFWIACALCLLARPDEALQILKQALEAGLWWPVEWLRDDEDLASLQGRPEFDAIVERAGDLRASRVGPDEPEMIILEPPGTSSGPRGAVVTLHGWGGRALDFVDPWRPVLQEGLLLAVPESSQVLSPGFHVWTDRLVATADVAGAYERLRAGYRLDEARLLAAGFSQGGGVAASAALQGAPIPAAAFLAVGTGLSDVDPVALGALDGRTAGRVRGWLMVGENDEALDDAARLHAELRARGVHCRLEVIPGVAHSIPPEFAQLLGPALEFLLPRHI